MEAEKQPLPEAISESRSQSSDRLRTSTEEAKLVKPKLPWPVSILNAKVSDFVDWLQNLSLVKLAAVLGESALLFAAVSYVVTIPSRLEQQIQEARKVLRQESGHVYSEGRIAALKTLDRHCVGNPGLEAPRAQLANLKIQGCSHFSLTDRWPLILHQHASMDLSYSNLEGANLLGADMAGINLQGSNLEGANLKRANLQGANLTGADLTGANLARADLRGAILKDSKLDESNFYGAQFHGADFSKASLVKIKALWADFQDANFYRANLQSANLNRTQLQGADFYKANLEDALLRFADLRERSNLQGAQLRGADLWGAQFWSAFQIKRANNWEQTNRIPNWEQQITQSRLPRLRIGLLKPESRQSIFDAYELGMRRAANRRVEIWGVSFPSGVDNEARAIQELVKNGMDAVILTPEDPVGSIPALEVAQDAGVAIITVDFCFDRAVAEDLAIACYDTNSFRMGYDSGKYLANWARTNLLANSTSPVQVALVDSAVYDRDYPYLQGLLEAIDKSSVPFKVTDSVSVAYRTDITQVMQLLENNPEVQILWGGSNLATEVTLEAVENLGLENQVAIFGILDLSRDKAQMLLDPNSPLQLIIDQYGIQIGYEAVKTAVAVLRGERPGEAYEFFPVDHRLLTEDDLEVVLDLLRE